jgi:sterol desaturase/sphingolipid hydroxylase (fatty acid hydroxylase superfamily)
MVYAVWLAGLSLIFVAAERIWPRNPAQPILRPGIFSDLGYIVFNSEYLGVLLGIASARLIAASGLHGLEVNLLAGAPVWMQFAVLLPLFDFFKWCIHNLLHRVGWLWEFHKVHHSIVDMDWIGDWRFHWVEVVVYNSLLYIPAAICGFRAEVLFWAGIVNTFVGHFAHANLRWHIGPLRYFVNSPEMHIWHHTHPESGPVNRNFGITLSVWDWLFGTAYLPAANPARLGFQGDERYPRHLPGQWLAPFLALLRRSHPSVR